VPGTKVKSVVITPDKEPSLRKKLALLRDQIRKRAFELSCHRGACGAPKADWVQAERETVLSPLAGVEENDREIRIIAAVPDIDPSHLTVDVLPDSIIVEGEPADNAPKRYSIFRLHDTIDPEAVRAELSNHDLTILAPKADTGRCPGLIHSSGSPVAS
jgi:hypothetical protein